MTNLSTLFSGNSAVCRAQQLVGQSVGSGVYGPKVAAIYGEASGSKTSWWDPLNPTRITVDSSGLYLVCLSASYTGGTVTVRDCIIEVYKNNNGLDDVGVISSDRVESSWNLARTTTTTAFLEAGDWVTGKLYHDYGSARTTKPDTTHLTVIKLT